MTASASLRCLALVLGLLATPALAGEMPTAPLPTIETGMHGAALNRIDVLGGQLVSVADDKTLRLWSLADGRLTTTVRVPAGAGNEGKLYAVAAQPGGKLLAAAGWTGVDWDGGSFFYLIDRERGRVLGRVGPFASTINHLAFSDDGRLLAVAFSGGLGLKVFDLKINRQVFQDEGYTDAVTWLDFSPDNRLAAVALNGVLRVYGADFAVQGSIKPGGGRKPFSVAFSPDGAELAVGYLDAPAASVHRAGDLKTLVTFTAAKDRGGNLSVVSHGGSHVHAAGTLGDAKGNRAVLSFPRRGGVAVETVVGTDTVVDLRPLKDGRVAFATAEPSWGVIAAGGGVSLQRQRGFADFRDGYKGAFRVSADAGVVTFGLQQGGRKPLTFDLLARSLSDQTPATAMTPPLLANPVVKPSDWQNGTAPKVNGKPIRLEDNEVARSVAVAQQGSRWLLGTDFYLRAYDGDRLLWKVAVPAAVWSVATADGRAVAGMGDGTVRWYGLEDGGERLALFAHADGKRWIAWTPEGFFDHSAGGESLFGYHLNTAKNREGEFVDAAQLYGPFFRRDLVVKGFLGGHDAEIAAQLAKIGDVRAVLARGLPPTLDVLEICLDGQCRPLDDTTVTRGSGGKAGQAIETAAAEVVLKVRQEDRGGGLGQLIVRRNGATVLAPSTRSAASDKGQVDEIKLSLQPGINEINLSATNTSGQIEANALEQVTVRIKLAAEGSTLPRLHVLSIGISAYALPELTLVNARHDAEAVANLMRDTRHKLYREAVVTTLVDGKASQAGIAAAFARLAREVAPEDVVLVFFAGHGIALDGRYFFIPADLPEQSAAAIARHGFSQQQLSDLLAGLQASRVVLMVDTCFAGSIDVSEISRKARDATWVESLSRSTGRFTLAGTTNEQEALDGLNGNGVFTSVVLKALNGEADTSVAGDRDGRINVYELARYTKAKVPEAVRLVSPDHKQEPTYHFAGSDFFDIRARE